VNVLLQVWNEQWMSRGSEVIESDVVERVEDVRREELGVVDFRYC
jgi:hypothetical protein